MTPRPLHTETINTIIEQQLMAWPLAADRFRDLGKCRRKQIQLGDLPAALQYNPARIVSTAADTSNEGIAKRKCFLCSENRPPQQEAINWMEGWELCINPFPILPVHFTIISTSHTPQSQPPFEMAAMAEAAPDLAIFFNGAHGGASAPDHLHLQAVLKSELPLLRIAEQHHPLTKPGFMFSTDMNLDLPFHFVSAVISPDITGMQTMVKIHNSFGIDNDRNTDTGLINVFYWMDNNGLLRAIVIPRQKHRPHQYFLNDSDGRIVVAPGAIDMTGLVIMPRLEDFQNIDNDTLASIYREVAFADKLPESIIRHFQL